MQFVFSESAKKDIDKLPKKIQEGLKEKFVYWQSSADPLEYAKHLTQHQEATHRFRFGTYRIIIKKSNSIQVLRIRHRKDVYR